MKGSGAAVTKRPFIATDNMIFIVLETWPPEWRVVGLAELEKVVAQKKKDDAKLRITQLSGRRRNEKVVAKVRAVCEAAHEAAKQKKAAEAATTEAAIVQAEEGQEMSSR